MSGRYGRSSLGKKRQFAPEASLYLYPNASWTDSILSEQLCSQLGPNTTEVVLDDENGAWPQLTLPACFWDVSSHITHFESYGPLRIVGSGQAGEQSDPLLRFSSGLVVLNLENATLVDPVSGNGADGSAFTPNWNAFLGARPSLAYLYLIRSNINGVLPTSIPAELATLDLSHNAINGSISSLFLKDSLFYFPWINLAGNKISGSIPADLFTNLAVNVSHIIFDVSHNELIGSLSSDLFTSSPAVTEMLTLELALSGNNLQGSIPELLLNASFLSLHTLRLKLDQNHFSGSISPCFFAALAPALNQLELNLGGNDLTGSIPNFFGCSSVALQSLWVATFNFSDNALYGSIPNALMPNSTFFDLKKINWLLAKNSLSGALPSSLLASTGATIYTHAVVDLSSNQISGTVPASLFQNVGASYGVELSLNLARNQLNGPLTRPSAIPNIAELTFDLSYNPIGGSVPESYLSGFNPDSHSRILDLNFARCLLTGSLPKSSLGATSTTVWLNFDNNTLSGSYPFDQLINNISALNPALFSLSVAYNQLSGQVSLPENTASASWLELNLTGNSFIQLITGASLPYLKTLGVGKNKQLAGSVPAFIFASGSKVEAFVADHTALNGAFPSVSGLLNNPLRTLVLSDTGVTFCGNNRQPWSASSLSTCHLQRTDAAQCSTVYPSQCLFAAIETRASSAVSMAPATLLFTLALIMIGFVI